MPSFQHRISKIVPKANYRHVEAFMRSKAILDFVSHETFETLAKECALEAKKDPKKAESFAAAMKLRTEPDTE